MRKTLIALVASILLSANLNAQVNNFSVSHDGKVFWQKIYDTALEHEGLYDVIVSNGQFVDVVDGESITFRIVRAKVDYKQLGFTRGSIPMYASESDVSCFVTIQIKDGRYRVTADSIVLTENSTMGLLKEGTENTIETWAVKGGDFTRAFTKTPSQLYDKFFSELFLLERKSYINDEW